MKNRNICSSPISLEDEHMQDPITDEHEKTNCACCGRITSYSTRKGRPRIVENNITTSTKHSHTRKKTKGGVGKKKKESKRNDAQKKIDNKKEQ